MRKVIKVLVFTVLALVGLAMFADAALAQGTGVSDGDGLSTFGYLALMAAITPVVLGITEAIKRAGVDVKWAPFVAMIVGVLMAILFDVSQEEAFEVSNLATNVIAGVLGGLAASGLYSGVPTIAGRSNSLG